jgi:hypothetical protein
MYSLSSVAVDKGLGFDFSEITNLVKSALPVGLNIFQQQMQLKQIKAMQQPGYIQSPGVYGQQYNILPISKAIQPQPTIGGQYPYQQQSGMDTTTMLLLGGGLLIGGLLLYRVMK